MRRNIHPLLRVEIKPESRAGSVQLSLDDLGSTISSIQQASFASADPSSFQNSVYDQEENEIAALLDRVRFVVDDNDDDVIALLNQVNDVIGDDEINSTMMLKDMEKENTATGRNSILQNTAGSVSGQRSYQDLAKIPAFTVKSPTEVKHYASSDYMSTFDSQPHKLHAPQRQTYTQAPIEKHALIEDRNFFRDRNASYDQERRNHQLLAEPKAPLAPYRTNERMLSEAQSCERSFYRQCTPTAPKACINSVTISPKKPSKHIPAPYMLPLPRIEYESFVSENDLTIDVHSHLTQKQADPIQDKYLKLRNDQASETKFFDSDGMSMATLEYMKRYDLCDSTDSRKILDIEKIRGLPKLR
jgi:hypothetical protein